MVFLGEPVDYKPASAQKGKSPNAKGNKKTPVPVPVVEEEEEIDEEVPSDLDEIINADDVEDLEEEEIDELPEGEELLEGEEDDDDLLEGEAEDDFEDEEEEGMQRPPGVLPIGYGVEPDPEDEIIPADEHDSVILRRKFSNINDENRIN